ncbi:hypothetical protein [Herbiconiux sp. YIM B11900]|uniref:hypothetical protein n=1 Tax=Herbiconiux sp. YIM B11900 TaxID=3404131 RepID=UPI003F853537
MDRRDEAITANVRHALIGVDTQTVAQATDIDESTLNERLAGVSPFMPSELVAVGGFLSLSAGSFLNGVAA